MKKVLIIEDDQLVANIYRNKFAVEGYQVETAANGQAGIESIRNFRPDAVVLDLVLPKVSGVELMKTIRAERDFKHLPIIVFSNTYLTNMVQEAWKVGATKCLSKSSCTPKQVIDAVRSCLSGTAPVGAAIPATAPQPQPAATSASQRQTVAPARVSGSEQDAAFQADLQRSFINTLPATLASLRVLLKGVAKAENDTNRLKQLHDLYRRVHALTSNAGVAGMGGIAQMADALEALLKELYEKPKNINASTLRTVAAAVDFLAVIFKGDILTDRREPRPSSVLVVDDELISRRAVTYALEKARLKPVGVEDPNAAYALLLERKFDLIFLDVDMPGMNGFELCAKLRALPTHRHTPVVFVTNLNDFESRANSTVSGGNDFIAKPFLFIELAVKALVYIQRGRFGAAGSKLEG